MVIADTSFLFSLFGHDSNSAAAHAWARQAQTPIALSAIARYELGNALRFAAFRGAITRADAAASLAAIEADLKTGHLHPAACDLAAVFSGANRLSELHTLAGGHRSFDILHIAVARHLKATMFLTFDANQRRLAQAARLAVGP